MLTTSTSPTHPASVPWSSCVSFSLIHALLWVYSIQLDETELHKIEPQSLDRCIDGWMVELSMRTVEHYGKNPFLFERKNKIKWKIKLNGLQRPSARIVHEMGFILPLFRFYSDFFVRSSSIVMKFFCQCVRDFRRWHWIVPHVSSWLYRHFIGNLPFSLFNKTTSTREIRYRFVIFGKWLSLNTTTDSMNNYDSIKATYKWLRCARSMAISYPTPQSNSSIFHRNSTLFLAHTRNF